MNEFQERDLTYVSNCLLHELRDRFAGWNSEYSQERDLGVRGEFTGLYRKARKLKTAIWDNDHTAPDAPHLSWREDLRTIAMEVAAHALLLVADLDRFDTPVEFVPIDLDLGVWVNAPWCWDGAHKKSEHTWRNNDRGTEHQHWRRLADCGRPYPCEHAPDGGNHPVVPSA